MDFTINEHNNNVKLSLMDNHQARRIISNIKKFVLLILIEGMQQREGNEVEKKASLEGCDGTQCFQFQ